MGVLAERNKKKGQTGNTAQKAYETFKQHYMPETDNRNPVPAKRNKSKNRNLRWVRGLVATAAILVIVIFGSLTSKAFGVNIWKAVIQWTQDTFHFGNFHSNSSLPYASLQEALEKGDITAKLAPTWFPDGYELVDIKIIQSPLQKKYSAQYLNGKQELIVTVRDYLNGDPVYVEQSEGLVEEYSVEGVTYYLFSNLNNAKAVWITGSFECYISGQMTIQEIKQMIDSIEKG